MVHAASDNDRDRLVDRFLAGARGRMDVLHDLPAARLKSGLPLTAREDDDALRISCNSTLDREHFGFSDGCSQPAIAGVNTDAVGSGVYARAPSTWWRPFRPLELLLEDLGLKANRKRWRLIRAGEFILGYENEDETLPARPSRADRAKRYIHGVPTD